MMNHASFYFSFLEDEFFDILLPPFQSDIQSVLKVQVKSLRRDT